MPMKINVGLSQKIGEPNYSSRGGNVHFEVEVDSLLLQTPDEIRKRIRFLFGLAQTSLAEQLRPEPVRQDASVNGQLRPQALVTERQLQLIRRLAEEGDVSLDELLVEVFDTARCQDLSRGEASQMIDILQQQRRVADPECAEFTGTGNE